MATKITPVDPQSASFHNVKVTREAMTTLLAEANAILAERDSAIATIESNSKEAASSILALEKQVTDAQATIGKLTQEASSANAQIQTLTSERDAALGKISAATEAADKAKAAVKPEAAKEAAKILASTGLTQPVAAEVPKAASWTERAKQAKAAAIPAK